MAEPDLVISSTALEDGSTEDLLASILDQASAALGEPVTLVSVDTSHLVGSVSQSATELIYTADDPSLDGLWGDDSQEVDFLYTVRTASGALHTGGVDIRVFGVNDAPTAAPDAVSVASGGATGNLWTQLLGNDHDPDVGQILDISAIDTVGALGRITFDAATQSVVYHADTDAVGHLAQGQTLTDTFRYTLHDEEGSTSIGVVTVTVGGGWLI
jgi:VCBS repeat-containing protein